MGSKNKKTNRKHVACVLGLFVACYATVAVSVVQASSNTVSNTVITSASSGGNSAKDGTVVEGKSSAKASVVTRYNDEVIVREELEDGNSVRIQTLSGDEIKKLEVEMGSAVPPPPPNPIMMQKKVLLPALVAPAVEIRATTTQEASTTKTAQQEVTKTDEPKKGVIKQFINSLFAYVFSIFGI